VPPSLPRHTRIILIPEDESRSREYVISRGMVLGLFLLAVALIALMVTVLVSYTGLMREARRVHQLQEQLDESQASLSMVRELNEELEQMRSFQERLLVMMGIEEPARLTEQDTLAGAVSSGSVATGSAVTGGAGPPGSLDQVAAIVMTPPPDLWPVAGFTTREFQEGDVPRGVPPHLGIDLVAPESTPIKASGKGRVSQAGWDDYLGNFVEIQHGFGYVTVYGHFNRLAVRKGDRIDRGQVIGYLGGTGEASAPHLHFEVWKEGVAVDPRSVIPGDPPR
jgi:murein DD-endopeptidase MepM/ murein hydrolase activator NlpD